MKKTIFLLSLIICLTANAEKDWLTTEGRKEDLADHINNFEGSSSRKNSPVQWEKEWWQSQNAIVESKKLVVQCEDLFNEELVDVKSTKFVKTLDLCKEFELQEITKKSELDKKIVYGNMVSVLYFRFIALLKIKEFNIADELLNKIDSIVNSEVIIKDLNGALESSLLAHNLRAEAYGAAVKLFPKSNKKLAQYKARHKILSQEVKAQRLANNNYREKELISLKKWVAGEKQKQDNYKKEKAAKEIAEMQEHTEKMTNKRSEQPFDLENAQAGDSSNEGTGNCWCDRQVTKQTSNYFGSGLVDSKRSRTVFETIKVRCPCK